MDGWEDKPDGWKDDGCKTSYICSEYLLIHAGLRYARRLIVFDNLAIWFPYNLYCI